MKKLIKENWYSFKNELGIEDYKDFIILIFENIFKCIIAGLLFIPLIIWAFIVLPIWGYIIKPHIKN